MGGLWQVLAPLNHRQNRIVTLVEFAMPERSEIERKRIIAAHWNNLGRTFVGGLAWHGDFSDSDRIQLLGGWATICL